MFAHKLKEIRTKLSLTQIELARIMGIRNDTISRLERNMYPPSYPTLVALVEKAGVKPAELF